MRRAMRCAPPLLFRQLHHVQPRPWLNGGGVTRELASAICWRISVADVVTDGAFSIFSGQTRHSVVIGGQGLELRTGTEVLKLHPMRCRSYDGGKPWQATRNAGPVRVFNVMTRIGRAEADVVVEKETITTAPYGGICMALCIEGSVLCDGQQVSASSLGAGDYVFFSASAGAIRFRHAQTESRFLLARIQPTTDRQEPQFT